MDSESGENYLLKLLQPELLTTSEMVQILKSLCVKRDFTNISSEELVNLYKKVALPLPQRIYGDSWRGLLLMSRRPKEPKRRNSLTLTSKPSNGTQNTRKIVYESENLNSVKSQASVSHRLKPPIETTVKNDRLKPPVDMINYERKTIKLTGTSLAKKDSSLDKIIINSRSRTEKSDPNTKQQEKRIVKLPGRVRSNSSELDKIVINKKVRKSELGVKTEEKTSSEGKISAEVKLALSAEKCNQGSTDSEATRKVKLKRDFSAAVGSDSGDATNSKKARA